MAHLDELENDDDPGCSSLFPDSDEEIQPQLCRLPKRASDYASPKYWAERYAHERGLLYDWYGLSYETFWSRQLAPLWSTGARNVLEIGSGNSEWSIRMEASGFAVTSSDIDSGVLLGMAEPDGGRGIERAVLDARHLPLRGGMFDVVVDKGTLDALLCGGAVATEPGHTAPLEGTSQFDGREGRSGADGNGVASSASSETTSREIEVRPSTSDKPQQLGNVAKGQGLPTSRGKGCRAAHRKSGLEWMLEERSGHSCLDVVLDAQATNDVAAVARAVYDVLADGGTWLVVTCKQPLKVLQAMHAKETTNVVCQSSKKHFQVSIDGKNAGVCVLTFTKAPRVTTG